MRRTEPHKPTGESIFAGLSVCDNRDRSDAARRVKEQREKLVRQLRRAGDEQATELATKLDRCSPAYPCWSGACPACGLAVRRHLTKKIGRILRITDTSAEEVMAISIVLPSSAVAIGELNEFDPANFARRLKYVFDRAGVAWVVGCLDYSLNLHESARYEPHWCVHLHGFTVTNDQQALRRGLVGAVRTTDASPRPVGVTPWDGSKKAIRYSLKFAFKRRKGVDNACRFNPKTGKSRTCRATKTQRLLAAEKVELVLYLDRIGWEGRLFMRHVQVRGNKVGPTIALINNHGSADRS